MNFVRDTPSVHNGTVVGPPNGDRGASSIVSVSNNKNDTSVILSTAMSDNKSVLPNAG